MTKRKKTAVVSSGVAAAVFLAGGVGIANAATLKAQLDTTTSASSTTSDANAVDIDTLGSASINNVVDVTNSQDVIPYLSPINVPDINVAPLAGVVVQFTITPGTILTAGQKIRIPFGDLASNYARGYVIAPLPPKTLTFDGVDAFTLSLDGTKLDSQGRVVGGYWVLTVLPGIADGKYNNIVGVFTFNEQFEAEEGKVVPAI